MYVGMWHKTHLSLYFIIFLLQKKWQEHLMGPFSGTVCSIPGRKYGRSGTSWSSLNAVDHRDVTCMKYGGLELGATAVGKCTAKR